MLDVTRLRVLAAIARHGSVTAAARELCYSQPSVSHHLGRLEAETGATLVQRVGRGIRLTEAGQRLAERAGEILGRLDTAEAELAAHTGLRQGRVRLASFPSALGTFVPAAGAQLAADYPGVELALVEAEPPEALGSLRTGEVDVALVFSHQPFSEPGVRTVELYEEPLYVVTPADRQWPGSAGDLATYAGARWIAGCRRCREELVSRCAESGFTPHISFTTDDYVAVQALVAAGLGVTTLPGLALEAARHPDVTATRLPGPGRRLFAATYGEPPDPPPVTALLDALAGSVPG